MKVVLSRINTLVGVMLLVGVLSPTALGEHPPGRITKETRGGNSLAPVVDVMPQIRGFHDYDRVREEMELLRELGFERVYFVLSQPGYPSFSDPSLSVMPAGKGTANHTLQSILALGDPNWAYRYEAQRQGMEAWAIIKPYESGSGFTIPHGAHAPLSRSHVKTVGGQHIHFDDLLSRRPDLRVRRKPEPEAITRALKEPIEKLEIAFRLDAFRQRSHAARYFEFPGIAEDQITMPGITLWISRDNGRYVPYEGSMAIASTVEKRIAKDANGFPIDDDPQRHLVITLQNLDIPQEFGYLAFVLDEHENLYTIPHSMIKAFTPAGEIPITAGIHVRTSISPTEREKPPEERQWGLEGRPVGGQAGLKTFMEWGFEFEFQGAGFWGDGWVRAPVFGIARGQRQYMMGTPCEAYTEVREYWLDQVKRVLAMGYDGIDFRLQNHSQMVTDYVNYGYNEPIVQRYQQIHGVDILQQQADPLKLMAIRGSFFLEFLEEAAAIIRSSGKKVQVHLRHAFEEPRLCDDFNELGFWAMPKIVFDWKQAVDLADEVTIKHYYHNHYRPELASQIKTYAKDQGKRVWVHCYIQQGRELNDEFFDAVEADDRIGGILLYEVADALILATGSQRGYHQANVPLLRSLMKRLEFD
ncbi:MAG: hypothetical protein EA424_01790 [Planctomycetaceae bacterium]|nr:MAG: hypothetical protein EA424_01790 [Planctomycetaceae bacterium]